ncbi:MAG: hypothetical protein U9P72_11960 [Campylobacterota bacterium]|nr:hypothetical protein [Campylobacterota bacterium]
MLENSVWRQYHEDNSFREKIADFCTLEVLDLIGGDKELYGVLKSKLTKKELKLFAMDCSEVGDDEIKKSFSCDDEELEKAKFKLYKKLKQDKVRLSFRESDFSRA